MSRRETNQWHVYHFLSTPPLVAAYCLWVSFLVSFYYSFGFSFYRFLSCCPKQLLLRLAPQAVQPVQSYFQSYLELVAGQIHAQIVCVVEEHVQVFLVKLRI